MIRIFVAVLTFAILSGSQRSHAAQQKYSPEFMKSAKHAWSLLQQASKGKAVKEADLSHAFAQLESVAHTNDEIVTNSTLRTYRLLIKRTHYEHSKKDQEDIKRKMKQNGCEIDEVLNKGTAAYQAAKDCGEDLP